MTAPSTPCSTARARTSRYLDGALRAEARAQVQDHLQRCPACLEVFRQTLELARRARELPRRSAPAGLPERARAEFARRRACEAGGLVDRRDLPAAPGQRRWRAPAAVAVLILVAVAAFAIGRLTAPASGAGPDATTTVAPAADSGAQQEDVPPAHRPTPSPPADPSRADPPRYEPPPTRAELVDDRAGNRLR